MYTDFKMGKLERENPAMKQATGIAGSREQLGIADGHEEAKTVSFSNACTRMSP